MLLLLPMALDGIRMPDGCYADGTWELKMHVTDLHRDVSLRVTGEIHIGGVMLKLVEKLGTCPFCFVFAENKYVKPLIYDVWRIT
ncbi:Fermitin 2 [Xenoophorus captivus]|uniref:Fermitin 2 n=1 Tax=Xenoophorus captivus TaxID=1517983 RepID=A0ABV0QUV9_9TELE